MIRAWLLTYTDKSRRLIWSEYRHVCTDGSVNFYSETNPGNPALNDHVYFVNGVQVFDIEKVDDTAGIETQHRTLGTPPADVRKQQRRDGRRDNGIVRH